MNRPEIFEGHLSLPTFFRGKESRSGVGRNPTV
jgi:hypothetical protein